MKNPRILILDEATSALDPKDETEVIDAIDKLAQMERSEGKKLTLITIAHRIETIKNADCLVYVRGPRDVTCASKGSADYDRIIKQL